DVQYGPVMSGRMLSNLEVLSNTWEGKVKYRWSNLWLLLAALAHAQAPTGEIAGTVYDASGGVVPNAAISVKNANTAFDRVLKSNQSGQYSVASLAAGTYEMRVDAAGFRSLATKAVVVTGAVTTVDLRLEV